MEGESYLTDRFLIAMPALADPNFAHTVTYICAHNDEGAMGIVVNRTLEVTLDEIFRQMEVPITDIAAGEHPVYLGGPVQNERGFVLHSPLGNWENTLQVSEDVGLAASRDILAAMAGGRGPERSLVALGYAGWGPGQLEQELANNAWLSGPADLSILFDIPAEQRWRAAAAALGVDLSRLSDEIGHA